MIVSNKILFHTFDKKENIVYNGTTGAIDILDSALCKMLNSNDVQGILSLDEQIITELMDRGYIYNDHTELVNLENNILKTYNEVIETEPLRIAILPTYDCNLSCTYCFEKPINQNYYITDKMLSNIFDIIQLMQKDQTVVIELYGGEPLLQSGFNKIKQILDFCISSNINEVFIITNGVNIKFYIDLFKEYNNIKLSLQVTIDGPEESHNMRRCSKDGKNYYNDILEGIELCASNNIEVMIRTNIDKNNSAEYIDLYHELEERFFYYDNIKYYLSPVTDIDNSTNEALSSELDIIKMINKLDGSNKLIPNGGLHLLDYLYYAVNDTDSTVLPKYHYCECSRGKYLNFCPDGNIYSCSEIVGMDMHKVGKFYPSYEFDMDKYNEWLQNNVLAKLKCKKCEISLLCGGGCARDNLIKTGKPDGYFGCKDRFDKIYKFFDYLREIMKYE